MGSYLLDWGLFIVLIIGLTALSGVITHFVGLLFAGKKNKDVFVDVNDMTQKGWRKMVRE